MRLALAALIVLLLPALLGAQTLPVSYLGMYVDEGRTGWCVSGTAPYTVDMWVCLLLGETGTYAYSFDLDIPSNVEVLDMVLNRYEIPEECLPPYCPQGINGTFAFCMTPPRFTETWLVHATLNVTNGDPSEILIVPNPDHGTIRLVNCAGGYESAPVLTNYYVNYDPSEPECGSLPVGLSTWGAIKSMYGTAP